MDENASQSVPFLSALAASAVVRVTRGFPREEAGRASIKIGRGGRDVSPDVHQAHRERAPPFFTPPCEPQAEETPESLMLATIGGSGDSKKRTDRQVAMSLSRPYHHHHHHHTSTRPMCSDAATLCCLPSAFPDGEGVCLGLQLLRNSPARWIRGQMPFQAC
eukprot:6186559-Pleurochrysis_carterae.AAC.13